MTKNNIKKIGKAVALTAGAFITAAAFYCGLIIRKYTFATAKLDKKMRLVLLTDLHGCFYGKRQRGILDKIDSLKPDAIVMSGDMLDEWNSAKGTLEFLDGLGGRYPCYYAAGNHEIKRGKLGKVKDIFRSYEVTVLDGKSEYFTALNGATITICGVDDPIVGKSRFVRQLNRALLGNDKSRYTVLLCHRPELLDIYSKYNCDLVLAGHAHGGQWRLPFLINGIIAPNQGLFPKYAGGLYVKNGTSLVVSRGLARESTPIVPRVFNPPELVVIDILPLNEKIPHKQGGGHEHI